MFGAITLIMAISLRATLLPTVSMRQAACSTMKRVASIWMRASAMRSRVTPCSATVRHQHDGLRAVARRVVGVGLAHNDVDLAARVASARGPPLAAIDDVFLALALDVHLDVGRIRGGHRGLGHQERRADLPV